MLEKPETNSKGGLSPQACAPSGWDAGLATPSCGGALRDIQHLIAPDQNERAFEGTLRSTPRGLVSNLNNLFRQISPYRLLTPVEERQVTLAIQSTRWEFHEALFSFLPIVRRAVGFVREGTAEGASFHHSRILHISTVDTDTEKHAIVSVARCNLKSIDILVDRCDRRWSDANGTSASEEGRASIVEELMRDRRKIATLLSEISMRPAFLAGFLSEYGAYVATARALSQGAEEAREPRGDGAALKRHLEASQESYKTLLEGWDRVSRAHSDYQVAKDVLITRNIRLAISEAKRYANRGGVLEDLIQEAVSGLLTAVEKFDPARGCRFSTYATPWIRQAILRSIDSTTHTVRMPPPVLGAIRKIDNFRLDFRGRHGRSPTPEEIADGVEVKRSNAAVTPHFVWKHQALSLPIISLESPDTENANGTRMRESIISRSESPALEVEGKLEAEERKRDIERFLAKNLDARQDKIIRLRFGLDGQEPQTLRQIGELLGITRERVRQLEKKAMDILKGSDVGAVYEREEE